METFVVISGCSGGGKSTLLAELARRGHAVVEEPGRRVVQAELARGGSALPWQDPEGFARCALELARADHEAAPRGEGWVFFDRGIVDAAAALAAATGRQGAEPAVQSHRYHRRIFLAPPWPEIFVGDAERRHGLKEAVEEYGRLHAAYPRFGYEVVLLPKSSPAERADFVFDVLAG
ncbi:AAA family ATPase [Afifella sp. IM 167]|uniref:AAA family ATPase n=1 Tax=Afifella sp. IM 167 TaxID=2033586 RepID=UPI001CCCCDAE|nr:AAA family ATPase [Afifella sp. IM 167]MBZ8131927.1 ATPase [Afifella sp. IM 167]